MAFEVQEGSARLQRLLQVLNGRRSLSESDLLLSRCDQLEILTVVDLVEELLVRRRLAPKIARTSKQERQVDLDLPFIVVDDCVLVLLFSELLLVEQVPGVKLREELLSLRQTLLNEQENVLAGNLREAFVLSFLC